MSLLKKTLFLGLFLTFGLFSGSQAIAGYVEWNTFTGSTGGMDRAFAMAVDTSGNIYITGDTGGSWGSPVRAYTDSAIFVAKFSSSGSLVWHTFLGDDSYNDSQAIAVDTSNNVYVVGCSASTWESPVNAHNGDDWDVFVAKLNENGALVWNTFLGGAGADSGEGVALGTNGTILVTGSGPNTFGSPVRAHGSGGDIFAAKLASDGSLVWNTFLGGNSGDWNSSIVADSYGSCFVTGTTESDWGGSPVRSYTDGYDVFVAKLAEDGSLTWHTFIGTTGFDGAGGITLATDETIYISGFSSATWGTPLKGYSSGVDGFAAQLNTNGVLAWNTFFGGSGDDYSSDIEVDASTNIYISGYSDAVWGTPAEAYSSGNDGFAIKFTRTNLVWSTFLGAASYDAAHAIALDADNNIYVTGQSATNWGNPVTAEAGEGDAFVAKLSNLNVSGVPTLTEWGLIIFACLIVFISMKKMKKQTV